MAVESRFVVIRNGVETQTFMDKKSADDYDKMLDIADNLTTVINNAPVTLSEDIIEELSIYFAQHRDDLLIAMQAKKAPIKKVTKPTKQATKEKAVTINKAALVAKVMYQQKI